jgi:hypothetical protein
MIDKNFVEAYIEECIDQDILNPKDICEKVINEKEEISQELKRADKLRLKIKNLEQVLKHFGHESIKRKRSKKAIVINPNLAASDIEPSYMELIVGICDYVESNKPVTPRNIMNEVGTLEDNTDVYIAIKWLCENGILKRNDDRSLEPGDKWSDRPRESKDEAVSGVTKCG